MKPKFDTCFFERYAQCTLESILGSRFAGLVNSDRPDLQDENLGLGIEVTRAIQEDQQSARALINEMADKPIFDVDIDEQNEIKSYGYAYGLNSGAHIGEKEYEYWLMAMPLKRIIESKVRKVMDGFYGEFNEFGLYVFTREPLTIFEVENTVNYIMSLQDNQKLTYKHLYLSGIHRLYSCNLSNASIESYEVSHKQCRDFYRRAIVESIDL